MTTSQLTKALEDKYGLKGMTKQQVCQEFGVSPRNKCFDRIAHTRHGRGRGKGYRFECESVAEWWNETRVPGYAQNIIGGPIHE